MLGILASLIVGFVGGGICFYWLFKGNAIKHMKRDIENAMVGKTKELQDEAKKLLEEI